MNDYVKIVVQSMRSRGIRSWLTILGIVIGVAAIVALITVSSGFKYAVEHQFEKMGISNIRIVPARLQGPPAGSRGFSKDYVDRLERLRSVDYVNPALNGYLPIFYGKEESYSMVTGYDTTLGDKGFFDADINLEQGRMFTSGEQYSVIIGKKVAIEAFDKDVRLKNSITIEDYTFKVIGIFEQTGAHVDDMVIVPLETVRELLDEDDMVNVAVVTLEDGISLEDGRKEIEHEFREEIDDEEIDVFTPDQLLAQFTQIMDIVQFVLVGIAAISLVVGAVGIMNSMFTSVLERTGEIGVMKAVGARNEHILLMFLIESGIIGAVGGFIGLLIGSGIALLINVIAAYAGFAWLKFKIQLGVVVFAIVFSFIIGAVSGIVPAMRAAQLNPVDALRYE